MKKTNALGLSPNHYQRLFRNQPAPAPLRKVHQGFASKKKAGGLISLAALNCAKQKLAATSPVKKVTRLSALNADTETPQTRRPAKSKLPTTIKSVPVTAANQDDYEIIPAKWEIVLDNVIAPSASPNKMPLLSFQPLRQMLLPSPSLRDKRMAQVCRLGNLRAALTAEFIGVLGAPFPISFRKKGVMKFYMFGNRNRVDAENYRIQQEGGAELSPKEQRDFSLKLAIEYAYRTMWYAKTEIVPSPLAAARAGVLLNRYRNLLDVPDRLVRAAKKLGMDVKEFQRARASRANVLAEFRGHYQQPLPDSLMSRMDLVDQKGISISYSIGQKATRQKTPHRAKAKNLDEKPETGPTEEMKRLNSVIKRAQEIASEQPLSVAARVAVRVEQRLKHIHNLKQVVSRHFKLVAGLNLTGNDLQQMRLQRAGRLAEARGRLHLPFPNSVTKAMYPVETQTIHARYQKGLRAPAPASRPHRSAQMLTSV